MDGVLFRLRRRVALMICPEMGATGWPMTDMPDRMQCAAKQAGVALTTITWEQDVSLEALPEAVTLPLELYVQGHVNGQLAEEWFITSTDVGGAP